MTATSPHTADPSHLESTPSHRDSRGRFLPGNGGGPGNPFARQVAKLRSLLIQRVRDEDMERIAEQLVMQSRLGCLKAIKLLFPYVLGRPTESVDPDTLDSEGQDAAGEELIAEARASVQDDQTIEQASAAPSPNGGVGAASPPPLRPRKKRADRRPRGDRASTPAASVRQPTEETATPHTPLAGGRGADAPR